MSVEEISSIAWVVWLALILIFLVVEIFTLDFTFLMVAVASVGGVISALLGVPWFFQVLIVAILSIVLLFAVRPPLLRALGRGADKTPSNIDALIGLSGAVSTAFIDGSGQVKLANGEVWTARLDDGPKKLATGSAVVVVAIHGATAVVALPERNSK